MWHDLQSFVEKCSINVEFMHYEFMTMCHLNGNHIEFA